MPDFMEIDFLGVETHDSGDAIALRYSFGGTAGVHVVNGGHVDAGDRIIAHLETAYGAAKVDNIVVTHPEIGHANGLRKILEGCAVGRLWMNRPWLYAEELLPRFETYLSAAALRSKLRSIYASSVMLEEMADKRGIPVSEAFQGAWIGPFVVLAPSKARYLDLIAASERTPDADATGLVDVARDGATDIVEAVENLAKAAWGEEHFPVAGTSSENEMSIVQFSNVARRVLLTGDVGREGLTEAADHAEKIGLNLPGIWCFQVPCHGDPHNVDSDVLDRWLGPAADTLPAQPNWHAACSSAKSDIHHPGDSVIGAMRHRGARFAATEGRTLSYAAGIVPAPPRIVPQDGDPDEHAS